MAKRHVENSPEGEGNGKPQGLSKLTPPLSFFSDVSLSVEGLRLAAQVRSKHLARSQREDADTEKVLSLLNEVETFVDGRLKRWVDDHPTAHWWAQIRGETGRGLPRQVMGKILGTIDAFGRYYPVGDLMIPISVTREAVSDEAGARWVWVAGIERLTTPSKLWAYAGLVPGRRRTEGRKSDSNITLRVMCFRLMQFGIMFTRNKYFHEYRRYKEWKRGELRRGGMQIVPTPKGRWCTTCQKDVVTKAARFCPTCQSALGKKTEPEGVVFEGHLDNMARRWCVKLFLSHLWVVYREALSLPTTQPYAVAKMGHQTIMSPWDMVGAPEATVVASEE